MVAGEASGDRHAADLILELQQQAPGLSFHGMGGDEMSRAGVEILQDLRELAVMGLAEVVGSLGRGLALLRRLREELRRRRPRALLLVDYPEFNLRLARTAKSLGIPVIYFISPQVWAWRARRVQAMSRDVDRIICILPFEAGFFRRHGARATYVGHPLVDQMRQAECGAAARRRLGLPPGARVLALLPGSRRQELRLLLPPMLHAATRLAQDPGVDAILVPLASTLEPTDVTSALGGQDLPQAVRLISGSFFEVLAAADVALVASGTSTLAAALSGTPMVLGYRVHPLTYAIGRQLTRVEHVGLVNLVAGARVVPELLQDDFTAENLWREARRLLDNADAAAARQRSAFAVVSSRLGPPGVFPRAAEAVVATLIRCGPPGL